MNALSKKRKEQRNKKIIELYRQGMVVEEILAKTKCSRATVYRVIEEEDKQTHRVNKPKKERYTVGLPKKTKNAIIKDYMNQVKVKEILKKYEISRSTMYRILWEQDEEKNEQDY